MLALSGLALLLALAVTGCGGGEGSKIAEHSNEPARALAPSDASNPVDQPSGVDLDADGQTALDVGTNEKAPCAAAAGADGSCNPRDVSAIDLFSNRPGRSDIAFSVGPAATVEEVMEKGLRLAGASPVHMVVRGTAVADSVRCDWRGIARTAEQREEAIRFWLGLDADDEIPDAAYLEALFTATIGIFAPEFPETAKSNFLAIVEGGLSTEYLFLTCYAEYTPSESLLGAGPTTLTVAYDRRGEAHSYELYRAEHETGTFGDEPLQTRGAYQDSLQDIIVDAEASLGEEILGHEGVVMLAPMGAHNAIAVEAWQAVEQWDLQTDDDDVVHAVRYGVPAGDPEHTQTLANLKTRVTTAAAADDFADDRIANVSGLAQYYRDIGAYGDITPDDGSTATFTPAQPPSVPACANGTAVTDPGGHRGLVHDCEALLDGKDELRGTATLDWSAGTAITGWEGVTTSGTPSRVTELELSSESLSGSIPAELGTLFELTTLDLSMNALTGDIPRELGWLFNLEEIRLSGNALTGCIPIALRSVATNDLSSLNLPYCRPPAPGAPTAGTTGETSVPLSWTALANTSKYRVEYRLDTLGYWTEDDDSIMGTSHTVDGLRCEEEYQFRLSAYGDGTVFGAAWSDPSAAVTATTGTCVPPVFSMTSYRFSVNGDAAVDALVGTVSATDNSGDPVTYAIASGDDAGLFAIGEDTGEITVAASLSGDAGTSLTLTVEAEDESGGTAAVPVAVAITATCDSGTAVPNAASNPGLLSDCKTLLGLKGALAGTGTLDWTADAAMTGWDGVTVDGSPGRVTRLNLERHGLTGVVPAAFAGLADLENLDLSSNRLTGEIPAELGRLPTLEELRLSGNSLTGEIPPELGDLGSLTSLWLQDNQLTGPIPPELGGLTALLYLLLYGNDLTGTIPAELSELTHLQILQLYGNELVGCAPPGLRDIGLNDLDALGLPDCAAGRAAAPSDLSVRLAGGVFTAMWTAVSGADRYEVQHRVAGGAWTPLAAVTGVNATYAPEGGPVCGTTYEFRARSHGDGLTHVTYWGTESAAEPVTTDACNRDPVFDPPPTHSRLRRTRRSMPKRGRSPRRTRTRTR